MRAGAVDDLRPPGGPPTDFLPMCTGHPNALPSPHNPHASFHSAPAVPLVLDVSRGFISFDPYPSTAPPQLLPRELGGEGDWLPLEEAHAEALSKGAERAAARAAAAAGGAAAGGAGGPAAAGEVGGAKQEGSAAAGGMGGAKGEGSAAAADGAALATAANGPAAANGSAVAAATGTSG